MVVWGPCWAAWDEDLVRHLVAKKRTKDSIRLLSNKHAVFSPIQVCLRCDLYLVAHPDGGTSGTSGKTRRHEGLWQKKNHLVYKISVMSKNVVVHCISC